jgi:CrcB protein
MPNLLLVMLGGAIGAALRYQAGRAALGLAGPGFPWGTLAVNLAGGLLMGVLAGAAIGEGAAERPLWLFLGVGVLGGFTTFSAFSLELFAMIERGDFAVAVSYVLASVLGSVMLLFAGLWVVRASA